MKFYLSLIVSLVLAGMVVAPALQAEPMITPDALKEMAATATTPAEHAKVAKLYKQLGEKFEKEAIEHEADVARLSRNFSPMAYKWPAMAPKPLIEAKEKAVQARRSAKECFELAVKHRTLALEAMAA